ncbi:MAG: hypothetical protein DF168_00706 [Candidatus Moanabacter tarae]|uniref:Uncharacterized protein n=1 Tax=Candidatus Moanibacter tarae TaxID=2200854 RepID=A0A2Z4AEZ1_9BACT|nr:MAG: hypothetical protein DF168_00706 [Candidatus Moanabacter tarae]
MKMVDKKQEMGLKFSFLKPQKTNTNEQTQTKIRNFLGTLSFLG